MKVNKRLMGKVRNHWGANGSARAAWKIIKEDCRDAGLTKDEAKQYMLDYVNERFEPMRNLIWDVSRDVFGVTLGEGFIGKYLEKAVDFVLGEQLPLFHEVSEIARSNRYKMRRRLERDDFYIRYYHDKLVSLEGGIGSV